MVFVGEVVQLDGSGSFDANNDVLSFSWIFTVTPDFSIAELDNPLINTPSFVADLSGDYVISLVVSDGLSDSIANTVTITATTRQDDIVLTLNDLVDVINTLAIDSPEAFSNKNHSKTLTNKINSVLKSIDKEDYEDALNKLENDILKKTDGCALDGSPDKDDWIVDCVAQAEVYTLILDAIDQIQTLIL